MTETDHKNQCGRRCCGCSFDDDRGEHEPPRVMTSWRMVVWSASAFLLPLAAAIAAAAMYRGDVTRQLGCLAMGLAAGVIAGRLITWAIRHKAGRGG